MQSAFRSSLAILRAMVRRFRAENMFQTASALAFTTLLALVPLVTLVVSLAESLPAFTVLIRRLDALLVESLLPTGAGGTIAGYIGKFSQKARALTVPGIALLSLTAFFLMQTMEKSFNHLWGVRPRPLLSRLKLYAFVMAVWPFLLGAIALVTSYAVTGSLGFIDETAWVRRFMLKLASMMLLGLFFGFLFYAIPNAKVGRRAAALGGIFASLAFALMQKGFELYLSGFGILKNIYGAFAAIPIFLVWLQLSWAVVLIGCLIAATTFRSASS